jgi:hypothetical protein
MTLTEFEVLVSEKLAKNDKKSREELLGLLNVSLLRAVIENMLVSQSELDEVAGRSYYHNNGFFKILLLDKRPKYSIRLHIWPEYPLQGNDIHNHPWDMSGLVLNGSYEWQIYTVEHTQEESDCIASYECHYLKDYSGHSFCKKEKVKTIEVDKQYFQQGNIFQLPSVQYHSVKKINVEPADSIVITGASEILIADVISSRSITCNTQLYNESVDSSFLREKLLSFMDRS